MWKGWSEQEVRGDAAGQPPPAANQSYKLQGKSLSFPITNNVRSSMGFTAINASNPAPVTASTASRGSNSHDALSPATVASGYLGRGEVHATAAPVAITSRKVPTKRKKRTAATKGSSKEKRRKSSNFDDGLHVTKVRPANEQKGSVPPSEHPVQQAAAGLKPRMKLSAAATNLHIDPQHVGDDATGSRPSKAKPVPVYGQTTSMDALASTPARTSVDSVKANAGQSITVYQDLSSSISHRSNVECPQPSINGATDVQTKSRKEKNVVRKKHVTSQVPTDDASVDRSSSKIRRSARAKPNVSYTGHDGFVVIDDTDSSDDISAKRRSNTTRRRTRSSETIAADDGFGSIDDDDILESAMTIDDAIVNRPATPPPRDRKQNMRDVDEHEDYGGALLTTDDLKLLAQIKTKETQKASTPKPIVRKPFPPTIHDRSPLFGCSNTLLLRTCFRVGEALNTGTQAVRSNKNVIIELYARVTSSWRDHPPPGRKQHFVFQDLYHDKPPYLEGTYELWDQAKLWDLDSRPFLKATEKGMMARVMARMRRDGQRWRLEVLSVYEVSWEDVGHVAGICNGDAREDSGDDDGEEE